MTTSPTVSTTKASLPRPPTIESTPTPPSSRSLPASPCNTSSPARPWIMSSPPAPTRVSFPSVPRIGKMVRTNTSLTLSVPLSVAVTRTSRVPISGPCGVPLNVRVLGLNVSQVGRVVPSARVALYARVSPASTSATLSAGTMKVKRLPCVTD